ncbi:MAG: FadR family transcriptional regulator [Desulfuromonas sp.]|nr:MAG: FadR family transcriptional regulator [Desulfuromonas sp.]
MTNVFKPIRPKKISEEIVEQIKVLISEGELKPGQRVPSERELAALLGVSRPSVREAIMVLDAMGLVESRQGGGTFVRSLTENALSDPLTSLVGKNPKLLHALAEVRLGLETWSAYLAAQRATGEEIEEMESLYREMERQAANGGWDADIDTKFHYAITAATHNTLQLHVLDTIHGLFHTTIQVALMEFYQKEGYIDRLLSHHRDILEAIKERDPDKARATMANHLELVMEKMQQLEQEKTE